MDFDKLCLKIRQIIFKVAYKSQGSHLAGSYSCIEILAALYYNVMKTDFNADNLLNDRFILSKGHCALAQYSFMYNLGYLTKRQLFLYYREDYESIEDAEVVIERKLDIPSACLGLGLSYSIGLALSSRIQNKNFKVYCLLGDGECQEGSIWEGALFAPNHNLNNLTVIIDNNKLQALDNTDNINSLHPLNDKWRAFGWEVFCVDGHNVVELTKALLKETEKPKVIIADTIKGKGIPYIEGVPIWHYRMPNDEELPIFLDCLNLTKEELIML